MRFSRSILVAPLWVAAGAVIAYGGSSGWRAEDDAASTSHTERISLDSAVVFFEQRFGERPDDIVAGTELSDRYMMRFGRDRSVHDVARADSVLRQLLDVHPALPSALSRQVAVYIARHEFPEAHRAALRSYALAPRRAKNGALFDTYFELARYDSAQAALNRMDPNDFGYLIRKARFAEHMGLTEVAWHALVRACRPDAVGAARLRAWCAVRIGDLEASRGELEEAQKHYRRALQFESTYTAALMGLGAAAFGEGRLNKAGDLYARAAKLDGGASAHLELRRIAELQGDADRAADKGRAFEQIARDPVYGRAYWSALAVYYAESARHEEALTLARRDVDQRPGPESYHALAQVLVHAGQVAAARSAIDSAMSWGAPDSDMLYHAGIIYYQLGDHQVARSFFAEAFEQGLDPDREARATQLLQEI